MLKLMHKLGRDNRGISALEYALLAGFILVGVGAALSATDFGTTIAGIFTDVGDQVDAAATAADNASNPNP